MQQADHRGLVCHHSYCSLIPTQQSRNFLNHFSMIFLFLRCFRSFATLFGLLLCIYVALGDHLANVIEMFVVKPLEFLIIWFLRLIFTITVTIFAQSSKLCQYINELPDLLRVVLLLKAIDQLIELGDKLLICVGFDSALRAREALGAKLRLYFSRTCFHIV